MADDEMSNEAYYNIFYPKIMESEKDIRGLLEDFKDQGISGEEDIDNLSLERCKEILARVHLAYLFKFSLPGH